MVIVSLVVIFKLNGANSRAYLCDVISRIVGGHPQSRLDELLPWAEPVKGPVLRSSVGWLAKGYLIVPRIEGAA